MDPISTDPASGASRPIIAASIVEHALSRLAYYKAPGYVAFVDALSPGLSLVDEWDALGQRLTEALGSGAFAGEQVDEGLMGVLRGRVPSHAEVRRGRVVVMFRSVPLSEDGQRVGALLLCRDVSELRRRERELSSKDATIRETHHRVKNSLQAVAAMCEGGMVADVITAVASIDPVMGGVDR